MAFKYRVSYNNFRAAAMVQIGGYAQGNASNGLYQSSWRGFLRFFS